MKLVCPSCGAIASAESWLNDELSRETLAAIANLQAPLPKAVLGYLSLFRPGQNGLTWKKALRLVEEINKLTAVGYVGIQGRVDRDCPASTWAQAMEQMSERRNLLTLPLKNHNYLRQVAYQLADQADARSEQQSHTARTVRVAGPVSSIQNPMDAYIQGLRDTRPTDDEMDEWRKERMQG